MNWYQQYMYSYPHKMAYRKLDEKIEDYIPYLQGRENVLYFHIPFCQSKCGYCNLFSVTGKEEWIDNYLAAMKKQSEFYKKYKFMVGELVIGGGTTLILSVKQLDMLFEIARENFHFLTEQYPITIETSPNQTTKEKVELLKKHHVTRVSIGVQSFMEDELKGLHRHHHRKEIDKALYLLKEAEFPSMNIDLIYGIPGQTKESLHYSLEQAVRCLPKEIFIYPLYVKKGTYLYQNGTKTLENTKELYWFMKEYLERNGYHQISMRRFIREEKKEDRSCGFEQTISIGCGGRSYMGNLHFCAPYFVKPKNCREEIASYCNQTDFSKAVNGYLLNTEEQRRRYTIKNLLHKNGINREEYQKLYKRDVLNEWISWEQLKTQGMLDWNEQKVWLTEEGMADSDYIGPMFISEEVAKRVRAWNETNVSSFVSDTLGK